MSDREQYEIMIRRNPSFVANMLVEKNNELIKQAIEIEDLENRIKEAIEYTKILREKYFKECVAGSSYELDELISILERGKE
jgi:hypothetical protein